MEISKRSYWSWSILVASFTYFEVFVATLQPFLVPLRKHPNDVTRWLHWYNLLKIMFSFWFNAIFFSCEMLNKLTSSGLYKVFKLNDVRRINHSILLSKLRSHKKILLYFKGLQARLPCWHFPSTSAMTVGSEVSLWNYWPCSWNAWHVLCWCQVFIQDVTDH